MREFILIWMENFLLYLLTLSVPTPSTPLVYMKPSNVRGLQKTNHIFKWPPIHPTWNFLFQSWIFRPYTSNFHDILGALRLFWCEVWPDVSIRPYGAIITLHRNTYVLEVSLHDAYASHQYSNLSETWSRPTFCGQTHRDGDWDNAFNYSFHTFNNERVLP